MESGRGNAPCACGLQPQPFACSVAGPTKFGVTNGCRPVPSASQTEVLLLHHDHHAKLAPADGFAPPTFRLTAGGSTTELRGNGKWSARSDLHAQGCLILNQVGLLFPVNHAPQNWRSWRDSHPLVIRLERATARRLCAQEQMVGTAGVAPATCSM